MLGTGIATAADLPSFSKRLEIVSTPNGPIVQGIFDLFGAGRLVSEAPVESCSTAPIGRPDLSLDELRQRGTPAAIKDCNTPHCDFGKYCPTRGCMCEGYKLSKPYPVYECQLQGCNENVCQDTAQAKCCLLCSQFVCTCSAPGYCTN